MLGPHIIFLTFEVEKSASLKTIYIIHLKKKNRKEENLSKLIYLHVLGKWTYKKLQRNLSGAYNNSI